jgi:hypothetical protein
MAAGTLQDQKPSPIERAIKKFGAYFQERGLGPADLPAAIIVHEVLGMIMASAAWAVSKLSNSDHRFWILFYLLGQNIAKLCFNLEILVKYCRVDRF